MHGPGLFAEQSEVFHPGIGSDISHPTRRETCYDRIPSGTMRERFILTCATGLTTEGDLSRT